ncbi:hypothetical protein RQP53_09725 [Paucibacter sp. APW11]|uniref:SPOR domain-containing protein n=1 Tax=Roseateles aquae TaxID=3077235 RepID=A0ABU3PAJ3_9BURK|nr:hypothetical protein [Paucibacter sp. APW11]MDT8999545.1 hypothetical protein [Paucibacter sp. APW11]
MLRTLVLLLLLANALFFSWSRGWLDSIAPAHGEREPERLQRQQHPERLQVLNDRDAAALQQRSCLEIGPLRGEEPLKNAQAMLAKAGIASSEWQDQRSDLAGVWAVATIKFPNKEFGQRKEETYHRLKINFEYLSGMPEEMPSMLLSRHPSEKAAEAAVEAMSQRALKGLRVLQLQAPQTVHLLQFPRADGALRGQLAAFNARPCANPPALAASAPAASSPAGPASSSASR